MWILTESVNDYSQHGDYFIAAFNERPSVGEIEKLLECGREYAQHIVERGGRLDFEGSWYYITEVYSGQKYVPY